MRTLILVNPMARSGRVGERWPNLEAQLLGALGDGEARVQFTSASDYGAGAVRAALREGAERILVVGGDGTVSEALQGFFERGSPVSTVAGGPVLGVMPAGRGDDFFKMLAGGRCKSSDDAWRQGMELLKTGQPRPVDLGRVSWLPKPAGAAGGQDRVFVNIASFGYPGLVVKRVSARSGALGRTRLGKSGWAYLVQIAAGLAEYKPIRTEVLVDGKAVFEGPLFSGFVLNGCYNAGGMRWSTESRIDDGVFEVVLSEPRSPVATALSGPRMLSGDWRGVKGVHSFSGRRVEIRTFEDAERGFPFFEIDGEQPEPEGTRGAVIEMLQGMARVTR